MHWRNDREPAASGGFFAVSDASRELQLNKAASLRISSSSGVERNFCGAAIQQIDANATRARTGGRHAISLDDNAAIKIKRLVT